MVKEKSRLAGAATVAVTALMTTLLFAQGCGKSSADSTTTASTGATFVGSGTSITPTPSSTTTSSTNPAYTYSFTETGIGGTSATYTTPAILTDTVLQVTVTAASAGALSLATGYSNFTANYGCISYNVTVLGQTMTTNILSPNPGYDENCPEAASSQMLDFSSRLTPGHGAVTVEISNPAYDFYCQMWESGYPGIYNPYTYNDYCPLRAVYKTHTVAGSLSIAVDGS